MDLFDSPIYSFPITKDFSKNVLQSPTPSPIKTTPVAPVTASPDVVNVPRHVYEAEKREAERRRAALEGRRQPPQSSSSDEDDEDLARNRSYRTRRQRRRRLGFDEPDEDEEGEIVE